MSRLPPPAEDELLTTLLHAARLQRWLACHFRPALTQRGWRTPIQGDRGFPDVVAARERDVLALELKGERGRYGEGQAAWAAALGEGAEARLRYYVVTPDTIDAVLAELR